jgi:signal transduction histidine kinase
MESSAQSHTSDFDVLGRVAGGIAHDLNNHLSPIMLGVQTLQRHDPDEKTKRILTMIELAARKASDLVRHILEYSRAARATTSLLSRNDVAAMLLDQVTRITDAKAKIVVNDDRQWSLAMEADVFMLIVTPLLANALESGSAPDSIELLLGYEEANSGADSATFVSPRDRMCLSISDRGCGMNSETLTQAAHPFFTTRGHEGHAGLGLFLAHTLVKQHNGTLHVTSQEREGTIVRIHIPVAAAGRIHSS